MRPRSTSRRHRLAIFPLMVVACLPVAVTAQASTAQAGGGVPVYATRLPPSAQLDYSLRHGPLRGKGQLLWAPTPDGYRLRMEGMVFGVSVLVWSSEGGVDLHGLAPRRFSDQRLQRAPKLAEFDREAGRIRYPGRPTETPLPAGAQDRLSWMVQLPAILLANPALQATGQRVTIFVTGARADADTWTFVVIGRDTLELPAGRVLGALHLQRAPREPGDSRAEAWLDPARGLLPVRARFSDADGSDVTDFLLAR